MNLDDDAASQQSKALAEAAAAEIIRREQAHAAASAEGYYGRPALKPPVWTWEVPVYLFVGGIAGTSAILTFAALWQEKQPLDPQAFARWSAWIACFGGLISAGLLIRDLGRPHRFINMMRVFKWKSPMSVGAWVLALFGALTTLLAIHVEWPQRTILYSGIPLGYARTLQLTAAGIAAALGSVLATYTGVLIGATAIPAWHSHHRMLPVHFGVAGLGSAAALLELCGFALPALQAIGFGAAAIEAGIGAWVEVRRHGAADRALRSGYSGVLMRVAAVLAGPVALALRYFGYRNYAAVSFLLGSLVSRFGWVEAGRVSAKDPEAALQG